MISLTQLLKEVQSTPKAIFIVGPSGAGKTYLSNILFPTSYITSNSDIEFEKLLKSQGIGVNRKDYNPEELSISAKLQSQAVKTTQSQLEQYIKQRKNIIIDSTGGSYNPLLKKKIQLEENGYKTLMVMVYVSPLISLKNNQKRDRNLMPWMILRNWKNVNENINEFWGLFGDNFIIINNNQTNEQIPFNKSIIKPYLSSYKAVGKIKSPEEELKSNQEKEELIKYIESENKFPPTTTPINIVQQKINNFTNE
jgi:predicted kinase